MKVRRRSRSGRPRHQPDQLSTTSPSRGKKGCWVLWVLRCTSASHSRVACDSRALRGNALPSIGTPNEDIDEAVLHLEAPALADPGKSPRKPDDSRVAEHLDGEIAQR